MTGSDPIADTPLLNRESRLSATGGHSRSKNGTAKAAAYSI